MFGGWRAYASSSYLNDTRSLVRKVAPPLSSRSRSCSTTSATRRLRIVSRAFLIAVSPNAVQLELQACSLGGWLVLVG